MANSEPQVFPVSRSALAVAKLGLGLLILVAVCAPVLFIRDSDWEKDFILNLIALVLFEAFFVGLIVYYAGTIWNAAAYSIATDEDGLWYSTLGKAKGLVR